MRFICDQCSKTFTRKNDRDRHLKNNCKVTKSLREPPLIEHINKSNINSKIVLKVGINQGMITENSEKKFEKKTYLSKQKDSNIVTKSHSSDEEYNSNFSTRKNGELNIKNNDSITKEKLIAKNEGLNININDSNTKQHISAKNEDFEKNNDLNVKDSLLMIINQLEKITKEIKKLGQQNQELSQQNQELKEKMEKIETQKFGSLIKINNNLQFTYNIHLNEERYI